MKDSRFDQANCSDIMRRLWDAHPKMSQWQARVLTKRIINYMIEELCKGNRIEIRKFGSFSLRHRSRRMGRNPKTRKNEWLQARSVPYFKLGKYLSARLNKSM